MTPEEHGMPDSQAKQVRKFVETLERNDRYIVLLYYADGLTPMEISRVLDLPSTRVRQRLDQLRAQLAGLTRRPAAAPAHTAQPTIGPGETHAAFA